MPRKNASELESFRARMESRQGRDFWRSLEEWSDSDAFRQYLAREFPDGADQWGTASRREFLKLMGASLALAGLVGCGEDPPEAIVPYVRQPEVIIPGKPLFYATAMIQQGLALGLLVESHMGRPIKIEGNPRHPSVPEVYWTGSEVAAPGVSDVFMQAEILNLYDPDRSQTIANAGGIGSWNGFLNDLKSRLEFQKSSKGQGIRLLTETVTSPTLARQITEFLEAYPEAKWHQFEPLNRDNDLQGAKLAFGEFVSTHYHLDRAAVILSLDADFLGSGPDHLKHAMNFADLRDVQVHAEESAEMNRLYVLESTPALTGAKADHRLPMLPGQIEDFAVALAIRLGVELGDAQAPALPEAAQKWLEVVASDLEAERTGDMSSLVIAGAYASPMVHALAHAMNKSLENIGKTVTYSDPIEARPVLQYESLRELVSDMESGDVDFLCILGGNPVYTAPADLKFAEALAKVSFRVHLSLFEDETSRLCDWHIPEAHCLEAWSDARAADGTVSILQPLIEPLYRGRTSHELVSALVGKAGRPSREIVKEHWRSQSDQRGNFETLWQTTLHDGIMPETALPEKTVELAGGFAENVSKAVSSDNQDSQEGVEVIFRPDPSIGDGRYANNGWLQELPKPFTKLTWDNAALISMKLAEELGLENEDIVELEAEGRSVQAPVWILPGQPDQAVTVHLGYGRTRAGRVGSGAGFNAYELQSSQSPWQLQGVRISATGERAKLAVTQHHHLMEGRDLVRLGTIEQWRDDPEHPHFVHLHEHHESSFFEGEGEPYYGEIDKPGEGYEWAMTIDLSRCIGCNACTIACQAENNIPVVGKDQVAAGREMHWIRVDSYYQGNPANPLTAFQPVPCMHCETAPCELVCPVAATVHGTEGLNEMVYNRCVGTRYCSNNCPYKVRRFNYLQYSETETPVLNLLYNPDVTVRNRGVMEKCTYCTQRISAARIEAEKRIVSGDPDGRIQDGEVVTACQAACPARAILFGDLNASGSRVKANREHPRNYALLEELNTKPRTTYLAAVRNPHPDLEPNTRKANG